MTFKQWWDGIEWGFAARILFKPIGQLFAEMAWNAAVKAERDACANLVEGFPAPDEYSDTDKSMWDVTCIDCAEAIRARGEKQ